MLTGISTHPMCSSHLVRSHFELVKQNIAEAQGDTSQPVRLVVVSKTKPVELMQEVYDAGHRCFGENYVQELCQKVPMMPEDVEWHFIGHLQGNKIAMLINGCPSIACVETIDSEKLARALNKAWSKTGTERKLRVMVQVNSSAEETKNGVEAQDVIGLVRIIVEHCPSLKFVGLMTIGAPDYSGCRTEDFETLHRCRDEVAAELSVDASTLELSMGMSADYANAIRHGSTNVRVGSSVFGPR